MRRNERIPDLLITDWRLGDGETGHDVARILDREFEVHIPVLVLTGDALAIHEWDDPQVPCKVLHKPILSQELQAAMHAILPERQFIL